MPYLTKQYKFCAAHRYWNPEWSEDKNLEIFGEDVKVHGHNYELQITINGPVNPHSGFVLNLHKLSKAVEENVISIMDHSQIELDIKWFENKQPSTENMVIFIWNQLVDEIEKPAKLYSILLRETPTIFTEYFGPEGKR